MSCPGRLHRPADHLACQEIHDDCQVQPALPGAEVGDVADPGTIRIVDAELTFQLVRRDDRRPAVGAARDLVAMYRLDAIYPRSTIGRTASSLNSGLNL